MPAILPAMRTGIFDYARRPDRRPGPERRSGLGGVAIAAVAPAAPASTSTGQFGRDGVPFGLDRKHHRANGGFVAPVLRV
jgi:hypothetical protein